MILKGRGRKKNLCCLGFILVVINTTKTGTNRNLSLLLLILIITTYLSSTPRFWEIIKRLNKSAPRESHPRQVLCRLPSLPVTVLSRSDCDGAGVSLVVLEECIFFFQSTCPFWVHLNFTLALTKSLCPCRSGFTDFVGRIL